MSSAPETPRPAVEKEHTGSVWSHPYMIYIALTAALFAFLVILAYLAWTNDWIPKR